MSLSLVICTEENSGVIWLGSKIYLLLLRRLRLLNDWVFQRLALALTVRNLHWLVSIRVRLGLRTDLLADWNVSLMLLVTYKRRSSDEVVLEGCCAIEVTWLLTELLLDQSFFRLQVFASTARVLCRLVDIVRHRGILSCDLPLRLRLVKDLLLLSRLVITMLSNYFGHWLG